MKRWGNWRLKFSSDSQLCMCFYTRKIMINMFKGIVKAQTLRFRRICMRKQNRVEAVRTLILQVLFEVFSMVVRGASGPSEE